MYETVRLAVALTALCAPSLALADDASELALSRAIVAQAYPEDRRAEMFGGAMDAMSAQMLNITPGGLPPQVRTIIREETDLFLVEGKSILAEHIPALMDGLALAYRDEFTEAELQDIADFIATPTGSSFMLRSTKLIASPDFARANEAYMAQIMAMTPDFRQRLETRILAFVKKHNDK